MTSTATPAPSARATPSSVLDRLQALAARPGAWPDVLLCGSALLVYLLATLLVLRRGFLEYNPDGYTRIIRGDEWLHAPRWEVDVWLPLQTWLFGVALAVDDTLTVTPRLVDALLTAWLLVNLYLIGRALGGRLAGLLAATTGALYPWIVWLGVSGMSEPLFHATLTAGALGLVRWVGEPRDRWLLLAAAGLLLSTMVRYEGWFYAAVFLPLVLAIGWRRGELTPRVVGLALLPLAFALVWMQQHWQASGDPLRFARDVAQIKAELDAENASAGLVQRLTNFPVEVFRLAPRLTALCGIAALAALVRRPRWWPLPALVLGQAVLFVSVSAAFSNLGPGAERYLLSNVILLFPVLGALVATLPARWPRVAGLAALTLAIAPLLPTLANPPDWYPDAPTRDVAELATGVLREAPAGSDPIPVLVPPGPDAFVASFALRVLTNHPDELRVTSDPLVFDAWLATSRPPAWIVDTAIGHPLPDATRVERVERFAVGWPAASARVALASSQVAAGASVAVSVAGLEPGEPTSAWLTTPAGEAVAVVWEARASAEGTARGELVVPADGPPGPWRVTVAGVESGIAGSAALEVVATR